MDKRKIVTGQKRVLRACGGKKSNVLKNRGRRKFVCERQ